MLDATCYNRNITVKAYHHLTDNASSTLSKDFLEVKMLITIFSLPMNYIHKKSWTSLISLFPLMIWLNLFWLIKVIFWPSLIRSEYLFVKKRKIWKKKYFSEQNTNTLDIKYSCLKSISFRREHFSTSERVLPWQIRTKAAIISRNLLVRQVSRALQVIVVTKTYHIVDQFMDL